MTRQEIPRTEIQCGSEVDPCKLAAVERLYLLLTALAGLSLLACAAADRARLSDDAFFFGCTHGRLGNAPLLGDHDDSVRYGLPFDESVPRLLAQGVGGADEFEGARPGSLGLGSSPGSYGPGRARGRSHRGRHRYAFDFAMPVGTTVLAARAGVVECALEDSISLVHPDGTRGLYGHLSKVRVTAGQRVRAKEVLGRSGARAQSVPHLHFSVLRRKVDGTFESLPIRFKDGSERGYVPTAGQYYGGGASR